MTSRGSLARLSVSVMIVVLTAMGSFIGALNLIAFDLRRSPAVR